MNRKPIEAGFNSEMEERQQNFKWKVFPFKCSTLVVTHIDYSSEKGSLKGSK